MQTSFHQSQPLFSVQDIFRAAVLILISLLFSFMPRIGYCQTAAGIPDEAFSPINVPLPAPALPETPLGTDNRNAEPAVLLPPGTAVPAPVPAAANPITANQYRPAAATRPDRSAEPKPVVAMPPAFSPVSPAVSSEHPFAKYWGSPNRTPSKITGKPMKVAEIFTVARSAARCRLLQSYWELAGLWAVYHFQCEAEQTAAGSNNGQQAAYYHEQCRSAEIEFIKQQRQFAEIWKQQTGRILRDADLPIPSDYPLHTHYETYADKIAQSDRTKYLGQMIPIQEQLIETKKNTLSAASGLPLAQQREAFCSLTQSIVEYNKMIAEYALETIPPNVSRETLIGAVIRLPDHALNRSPGNADRQNPSSAASGISLMGYDAPVRTYAVPAAPAAEEYRSEEHKVNLTEPKSTGFMPD
ncbi:MAG: hypothetical protein LBH00_10425 [Planctomycetaceae bacterium]|jgi:hypothetical protein|nr:hypothetical protein [Planctomycetaceae bacterium]